MKNPRFSAIILAALSVFFVASFSYADEPGCLQAIQGRAIDDQSALKLPKNCQAFRKAYLAGLKDLANDSKKIEARLKKQIESAKGNASPYSSMLIAVLSQTPVQNAALIPALEKRAFIEKKLKLNFPYAAVALERLKTGGCASFKNPAYDELCLVNDALYSRVVALNQAGAAK